MEQGTLSGPIQQLNLFDRFGNEVLEVTLDPYYTRSSYDAAGRLIERIDPANRVTSFTYDGLGRLAVKRLPDGATVTNSYNAEGGLTSMAMPGGLTWTATYNAANQRTGERLANGGSVSRQFTNVIASSGPLAGLTLATIDLGRAVTNAFVYDAFGRLATNSAGGPLPEQNLVTSYQYDARGLIVDRTETGGLNPRTSVTRQYDGYGEVTYEAVALGGQLQSWFNQAWDAAGRRRWLSQPSQTFGTIEYGYDVDGRLTSLEQAGQTFNFGYEDSALLWSRSQPGRVQQVFWRYSNGRAGEQGAWTGTNFVFDEVFGLAGDDKWFGYAAARAGDGAWDETRYFQYNPRGQLTQEGVGLATGVAATNQFTFDANRLGVLAGAQLSGASSTRWQATAFTPFGQVAGEALNQYALKLRANGSALNAASVSATLDGAGVATVRDGGRWYADLSLAPGPHTLAATAQYNAGQYAATATSAFNVLATNGVANYYDAAGNVVTRVFPGGGVTNKTQALKWDAAGRLVRVTERDNAGNGFDWSAMYDALGRRLRTVQTPVVSNLVNSPMSLTLDSTFDPEVEFLELAVAVNGDRYWKVMGPDVNGEYGGLQGTGGLEGTIREGGGALIPIINDAFGNVLGRVSGNDVVWNPVRVSGYGVVPGYGAPQLAANVPLSETLVWRGRRSDPTGFYWLGARYYDSAAGRFLSPDPEGHDSCLDLYAFADGDPINGFDADGRFVAGIGNGGAQWASQSYADAGNLLDFVMRPIVGAFSERAAMANFPGGHEADPNYERNFENGSAAFQLGHVTGYVGAELGFQVGLTVAARGLGLLARTATLQSMGMAGETAADVAFGARSVEAAGGAGSMTARIEGAAVRAQTRVAAVANSAWDSALRGGSLALGRGRPAFAAIMEGSWGDKVTGLSKELMPSATRARGWNFAELNVAGQGWGNSSLSFANRESALSWVKLLEGKRKFALGFIKQGKVTLFAVTPSENIGHLKLIEAGRFARTPGSRGFSIIYRNRQFNLFIFSEVTQQNDGYLSPYHVRELQKLMAPMNIYDLRQ